MAAAIQGGYINALPTLTSAAGGQLTSLSPPNGVTLSTVAPSSGKLVWRHYLVADDSAIVTLYLLTTVDLHSVKNWYSL